MTETARPTPLQLALTAIGDWDRANQASHELPPGDMEEVYHRAQLRTLYAIAHELNRLRAAQPTPPPAPCHWDQDGDAIESDCGITMIADPDIVDEWRYCPNCGRPIQTDPDNT